MKYAALLLPLFLLGQAPSPQPVPPDAILLWDAPTTNADGTPCTDLAGFIVAITATDQDLNAAGAALTQLDIPDPATTQQHLQPLFEGLDPNTYRLWVSAYDEAKNRSTWAGPLDVYLNRGAPGAPGAIRIKITVLVEINQ